MADASDQPPKKSDVLFVHSPTPGGDGYRVIRAREDRVEIGEMSDVKEGQPIRGEVVKLKARRESPQMFDVEVVVPRTETAPRGAHAGPPQVATDAYRDHWDAIFERKPTYLN